jgi:hypothetical protein
MSPSTFLISGARSYSHHAAPAAGKAGTIMIMGYIAAGATIPFVAPAIEKTKESQNGHPQQARYVIRSHVVRMCS